MTQDIKIMLALLIGLTVFTIAYYLYKRHEHTRSRLAKLEAENKCLEWQNEKLFEKYDEIRVIVNARSIDNLEALEAFKLLTKTAFEYEGKPAPKNEIVVDTTVKTTD